MVSDTVQSPYASAAPSPRPAAICLAGIRYAVTFDDEFSNARSVDQLHHDGVWDTAFPWGRSNPGAKDAVTYVDDAVAVGGDGLEITATRDPGGQYRSGVVTTRRSFSQTYGYFEARLRAPSGRGIWPAFWMLPVHGYPRGSGDPEIDIMEMLGDRPATIYQTTHAAYHAPGAQFRHTGIDASTGFHRYGARWTPSAITFYIDGQETGSAPNVFTQPMYLMANLQVGAPDSWPGAPDGATSFPATMTVAYIRAYQPTGACS